MHNPSKHTNDFYSEQIYNINEIIDKCSLDIQPLVKCNFHNNVYIEIYNEGTEEVKLLSRYWHIKDGNGHVEEIRGPGVVGLKPIIKSEEIFKYSSYCPLKTPFGVMHGSFQMINSQNSHFDVLISPFSLTVPDYIN